MKHNTTWIAFVDLLLCMVVILVFSLNPVTKEENAAKPVADYSIVVSWQTGLDVDIDTLVMKPDKKVIHYRNKDGQQVALTRDDLGREGGNSLINIEVVELRELKDGDYYVTINNFGVRADEKISGQIVVEITSKEGDNVASRSIDMPPHKNERGIFKFRVEKGKIVSVENTELKLIGAYVK